MMKRMFLLVWAVAFYALTSYAQQANIYVSGNASAFSVYALPKAENTFTTPAPTTSTITVESSSLLLSGDYYGDIRIIQEGNQLTITAPSGNRIQVVKIYDLQGRTITSKQGLATGVYSISAPDKGIYIVEIQVDGARNVQKIMVR